MKRPNTYQLGFAYPQTLTCQSMQEAAPGCIWSRSAGSMGKKDWWLGFLKEFYLVSAQIRHCPWNVLQEGNAWVMLRQSKLLHWRNDTSIQDHISQIWSITGNITQSPNRLLNNFRNATAKKTNKGWNGALFHNSTGLARMARSNFGQGPSGFEL